MDIATSLNELYVPYTYVMLRSLFVSNPDEKISVYLITDGLENSSISLFNALGEEYGNDITVLDADIDTLNRCIGSNTGWPLISMVRLNIAELIPYSVKKLLYLDSDLCVIGDITSLWNEDFEGMTVVAAGDVVSTGDNIQRAIDLHGSRMHPLIERNEYFNSGVMLFDMEKLRKNSSLERYMEAADDLDHVLPYPDQDILNYIHNGDVKYIDEMVWNFQGMHATALNGGYDKARVLREVKILHFLDKKPWSGGDHVHYDIESIWWKYAAMTPMYEELMKAYIEDTFDPLVHERFNAIINENRLLKDELKQAVENFQILYAAYEKLKNSDKDGRSV